MGSTSVTHWCHVSSISFEIQMCLERRQNQGRMKGSLSLIVSLRIRFLVFQVAPHPCPGSSVSSGSIQLDDESIVWRERVGRCWTTDLRSFKGSRDSNQLDSAFSGALNSDCLETTQGTLLTVQLVNVVTNCEGLRANMPATVMSFSPVGPNAGLKNASFVPHLLQLTLSRSQIESMPLL